MITNKLDEPLDILYLWITLSYGIFVYYTLIDVTPSRVSSAPG